MVPIATMYRYIIMQWLHLKSQNKYYSYVHAFFRTEVISMSFFLYLFLFFVPILILPSSLAFRDGAKSDSCYGHEIMHVSGNPMVGELVKQDCLPPCRYDLILMGRLDDARQQIIDSNVMSFECGKIYQCKYMYCG